MPCISGTVDPVWGLIAEVRIGVTPEAAQTFQEAGEPVPAPRTARAMLDPGSNITSVDLALLKELGLTPKNGQDVFTVTTGARPVYMEHYEVQIFFPRAGKKPTRNKAAVVGADFSAKGFAVALGRDCLQLGLLVYDGPSWKFTFAYDCE